MSQARSHQRCVVCRCSVQRSELFETLLAESTELNHYPEKICFILSRRKISKTASQDRPRWSRLFKTQFGVSVKPSVNFRVKRMGWPANLLNKSHCDSHNTQKPASTSTDWTDVFHRRACEEPDWAKVEIHDGSDHMTKWPTHRFNFNSAKWHLQLISAVIFTGIQFCNMFFFSFYLNLFGGRNSDSPFASFTMHSANASILPDTE